MLQVKQSTEEQTQQEQTRQGELHKSITDTLLSSDVMKNSMADLGLSPKTEEEKPEKEVKKPIEEKPQEEEEKPQEEEQTEEEEQEDEDEEVIPKSKVQKRFDELTAQLKAQRKELEELRNSKSSEPRDEVSKQLEAMTQEQLKAAKLEVRKAQIKAQDDDARLNELLALEDKIDSAMNDAPKNFMKAQVDAFNRAAREIADSGDIKDLEKASPEILKLAKEIFDEHPSLQKDINGQASALKLAVRHYKAISNNSVGGDKTKEVELKRQVNNLKRKTTLDTKTGTGNMDKAKLDTLKKNAIGGTLRQKVDLVRSHPMFNVEGMIPEEFKER